MTGTAYALHESSSECIFFEILFAESARLTVDLPSQNHLLQPCSRTSDKGLACYVPSFHARLSVPIWLSPCIRAHTRVVCDDTVLRNAILDHVSLALPVCRDTWEGLITPRSPACRTAYARTLIPGYLLCVGKGPPCAIGLLCILSLKDSSLEQGEPTTALCPGLADEGSWQR